MHISLELGPPPAHFQPLSILQSYEHPSPSKLLPSSHYKGFNTLYVP